MRTGTAFPENVQIVLMTMGKMRENEPFYNQIANIMIINRKLWGMQIASILYYGNVIRILQFYERSVSLSSPFSTVVVTNGNANDCCDYLIVFS